MTTNQERREQIAELRRQLKTAVNELEKQFRNAAADLVKNCNRAITDIEREIKACEAQEMRVAREQIRAILEQTGIPAADVLASLGGGKAPRKKMKPSEVRHVGPNGEAWNGRGRVPNWYKARQRAADAKEAGTSSSTRHSSADGGAPPLSPSR